MRACLKYPLIAGVIALTLTAVPEADAGPASAVKGLTQQESRENRGRYIEEVQQRRRRRRSSAGAAAAAAVSAASLRQASKAAKAKKNTLLFGTHETESDNFKPFKKWNGAMERMAKEQSNVGAFQKRFKTWVAFLNTLKGKDKMTQIKEVNAFMNKSKYIQDAKNWGVKDYWASPGEFLAKFGDCEDYSIAKYMALKYLGHDPEDMRVVALKDLNLKVGHAILVYYFEDRIVVLDNQIKIVADSRKIRHYQPVYSINEKAWWRHRVG